MTTIIESCQGCRLAPIPGFHDNPNKPEYYCFDIRWTTDKVGTCPCQYCLVKGICTEICKEKITWVDENRHGIIKESI